MENEKGLLDALMLQGLALDGLGKERFQETCRAVLIANKTNEKPAPAVVTTEVLKACLEARRSAVSAGSLESYGDCWRAFARLNPTLPITPEGIETYLARYSNRRTARDVHTKLSILYEFANQRFGVPNVLKLVKKPRFKESEKPPLTLDQARAVVNVCRNDRELGLIHLYLGHGWRLEEACRLNVADIGDNQVFCRGKVREEFAPLLPETRELLLKLASDNDAVFTSQYKQRLSSKMAYVVVKSILARAGITGKGYSTHTLRHTFATLAKTTGMDDFSVARLLRHSKRRVTEGYVHLDANHLRQQLERYSPLRLINGNPQKLDKTEY